MKGSTAFKLKIAWLVLLFIICIVLAFIHFIAGNILWGSLLILAALFPLTNLIFRVISYQKHKSAR